jgi:hypothetical protein
VDKSFRAAYARADPSFSALVRACGAEPAGPAPGGTPRGKASTHASLRAAAARALASTLIRDGDCRKRAIKSGGFGALVKLAADAANDDVRRAASETVASFAREPRIVSKVKTLDADVKTCARAMRRCLEAAPGSDPAPRRKPSRVAKDTARAVCASMAGMLRALARRAASARKRAAADGDPASFAAATKPVTDGVLSQMVTHAHAVSTARRQKTFFFGETHAAASFGVLAALAEDRASCERLVRLGDRPRTPPPFTTEELETFQLEAFQARKEGRQYTQPVRVKAEWDPTLSVVETCKKTLSFSDQKSKSGSGEKGCARVAAAVVLARILEHERGRDEEENVSSDHLSEDVENALEGEHRAFLVAEGAAAALLTSAERGASAAWRAPLAETSAAALMYLATPRVSETCPLTSESSGDSPRSPRDPFGTGTKRMGATTERATRTPSRRRASPRSFWRRRCGRSRARRSAGRLCCAPRPSSSRRWSPPGPRSCPGRARRPKRAPRRAPRRTSTRSPDRTRTRTRASSRWSFSWRPSGS